MGNHQTCLGTSGRWSESNIAIRYSLWRYVVSVCGSVWFQFHFRGLRQLLQTLVPWLGGYLNSWPTSLHVGGALCHYLVWGERILLLLLLSRMLPLPKQSQQKINEHCCLLKNQVEWMIRANSLASHSLDPVLRAPNEKKLLEFELWSREGAIFASCKIPRAPPGLEVWVIMTCSMCFKPRAGAALWGSGGNSSGIWARFLSPGILKT